MTFCHPFLTSLYTTAKNRSPIKHFLLNINSLKFCLVSQTDTGLIYITCPTCILQTGPYFHYVDLLDLKLLLTNAKCINNMNYLWNFQRSWTSYTQSEHLTFWSVKYQQNRWLTEIWLKHRLRLLMSHIATTAIPLLTVTQIGDAQKLPTI